jgi:sulfate adenylyltransferase
MALHDPADEPRQPLPPRDRHTRQRRGLTVFLTGLPGAGKSTLAGLLRDLLLCSGTPAVTVLDGDDVRQRLSPDLGFSTAERNQHIRRVGFVAREVTRHGGACICAVVAPLEEARREVRQEIEQVGTFVLVHVATPLATCERRDPKGLYARARAGQLASFTGVSAPYEPPVAPDITLDTSHESPDGTARRLADWLSAQGYVPVG